MELTQAHSAVVADQEQNTLHIVLRGRLTGDRIERLAVEAVTSARHLSSGFTVVTDVSEFPTRSSPPIEPLVRTRAQLAEMGCGRMISVVGTESADDPTRGDHQVETTTSLAETDVTPARAVE